MGASPLFPHQQTTHAAVREALLDVLGRDPACLGWARSRWTLALLIRTCSWLGIATPSGISRLLKRLRISYKRGRDYVHSPDPQYCEKQAAIGAAFREVQADPAHKVLLFLDEVTLYRSVKTICFRH